MILQVRVTVFQETILFMIGLTSKVLLWASVAPCSSGLEKNNLEFIPKIKSPKSGNSIEKPWIHLTSTSINIDNIASLENNTFWGQKWCLWTKHRSEKRCFWIKNNTSLDKTNPNFSSWWFQPICSQNGNLPQIGVKIKHIWSHQPVLVDRTLLGVQQIPKLHREASGIPLTPRGWLWYFQSDEFSEKNPWPMGRTVYSPTWMVDFYGNLVNV